MIRRVFADRPSFRALGLQPGLNLVIADVTPTSQARDTRNGVGKTSLLEIIHYCLGGTLRRGDTLREPALNDWTFSVELDVGPSLVVVSRRVGATSVTAVVDTSCQAKAAIDHLGELAKTVPTPDYKKLGVFPVEDPRWNQGAQLSSRPELVSYEAAKTSLTSPDAVMRATAFGFRPVSSPLRGVLKNGYAAKPQLPNVTILYAAANQFSLHGQVWEYEPPSDSWLAVTDPDKLCAPDEERHCFCTPTRPYFSLGNPTVKAASVYAGNWGVTEYLGAAVPAALFPALHKYAVPGTETYRTVTSALQKGSTSKWNRPYTDWNVPMPADGSFRYPARNGYLPRELFASVPSSNEAAAGVYFQTPVGAADAWTLVTGTHAEVLSRVLGYERWLAETWIVPGAAGRTIIAVRHAGYGGGLSGWDAGKEAWVQASPYLSPGSTDYAEYDFPSGAVGPKLAFAGGKWPTDSVLSEHLTASKWYPGATQWLTNYGNAAEFTQKQRALPARPTGTSADPTKGVAANPSNTLLTHWAPSTANDVSRTYAGRVERCGPDQYGPNDPARHWPVALEKGSFAGLWGHSPFPDGTPGRTTQPSASFAGDYAGSKPGLHLHEGLDINWVFRREYIDPAFRGPLTGTATTYCWGTYHLGLDASDSTNAPIEVVIPCTDGLLGDCTDGQLKSKGGCTPLDRLANRAKDACSFDNTKKCSGFFGCVGSFLYDLVKCPVGAGIAASRFGLTGLPLNTFTDGLVYVEELDFHKRDANRDEDEHIGVEAEHRLVAAGKTDGKDLCEGIECSIDTFVSYNGIIFGNAPGDDIEGLLETRQAEFGVTSVWGSHNGKTPTLGEPRLFPASRFPGFASQRGSIYGATARVASLAGGTNGLQWSQRDQVRADAVSLLPDAVRERTLQASSFADPLLRETSFRIELVGDLILDCGHPPIHVEIHPFRAGLLHATPPPEDFGTAPRVVRYSLFGWIRPLDQGEFLDFDLWPPPRPRGATKLSHRFLLPGGAVGAEGISCEPWPPAAPNRLRCKQSTSQTVSANGEVCGNNPRMNPSCAVSFGGGLVEVYWE
jgi:hypothetical protein